MKQKNMDRIWVSSEFSKKLKREAVENDMSIIDYTDKLASNNMEVKQNDRKKKTTLW